MKYAALYIVIYLNVFMMACDSTPNNATDAADTTPVTESPAAIRPAVVSAAVMHDSDDPAIWWNKENPEKSLVLGTDKGGDTGQGGVYVFRLDGSIDSARSVTGIGRPNNVDIEYGFMYHNEMIDIAVAAERTGNRLLVYRLPDMTALTPEGIPVFEGEQQRDPMGVALYKRPDGAIFAIVSRKTGPAEDYLWQYQLKEESGRLTATLVRKFGRYSGKKEIEAIAVDDALGYVYYSDEQVGVRKYSADPDAGHNDELALFATEGFADDHEGISIYATSDTSGYVLVSDQGANKFHVFPRQGRADDPHRHPLLRTLHLSTISSDGSDVTSQAMGAQFPNGLFVAMSDDKTFQLYQWEQLAGEIIK